MGRQVYQEGTYKVYHAGNNYIVHNASYEFSEAHTHVHTLNIAKNIIYCSSKKIIPRTFSEYLLISLIRINNDSHYKNQIETLIEVRKQKGKKLKFVH